MMDIKTLYNLDYIVRYSNVPRIKDETVAAHSFFVTLEVYKLYESYKFDIDKAVHMAMCHDLAEAYIDDVNHKIKRDYPKVAKALKAAEQDVYKKFPPFIQEYIKLYEDGKSVEAQIVKLADILQCKTYSQHEVSLGNSGYMSTVLQDSKDREKILKKNLKIYKR